MASDHLREEPRVRLFGGVRSGAGLAASEHGWPWGRVTEAVEGQSPVIPWGVAGPAKQEMGVHDPAEVSVLQRAVGAESVWVAGQLCIGP